MIDKEETLKILLKNLLEERLSYLEKRNLNQMKDLKFETDAFNKQELLVQKLCSIKIEPKKPPAPKNTINSKTKTTTNKSRGKTPAPKSRSNNKNTIKKEPKGKRSVTPDISTRNLHTKKKDTEKGKTPIPITKNKTETQLVKKNPKPNNNTNNNNKTKPYLMANNNESKNDKKNTENKKMGKRSLTADVKFKNQNKKPNKVNENTENNLKLTNLKIENAKSGKKKDKKEDKKITNKKEETNQSFDFDKIISEEKLVNKISSYLDTQSQLNFFACNKKLIKYTKEKLSNCLNTLELKNDLGEFSTIQDQINSLKLKYSEEQLNAEPEKFTLSKITSKSIERLNIENYLKIFHDKELYPPLNEIIIIYRIFFQFLKGIDFKNIQDDKLFWIKASDYILNNSNGKLGDFFQNCVENLEFNTKNIFEVKKLVCGKEEKIKPSTFSTVCGTTGLVAFLIKDCLEYCGIMVSTKKNVPYLCLKYLEYIEEMQNKLKDYIENINNLIGSNE